MDFLTPGTGGPQADLRRGALSGVPTSHGWPKSAFAEHPNSEAPGDHNAPVMLMQPPPPGPTRREIWTNRMKLVVWVLVCIEVGIILIWFPWTKVWSENSLVSGVPAVKDFLSLGFVRGAVTGLGFVNIWMGIAEALRYREHRES